jgi:predicted ABC-type ATPase
MPIYPQLLFVAGPNGAGKSTFSKKLSDPGAVIFDVDKVIARIEAQSPDMPKKQVYQAATNEFIKQASDAVKQKQHFTLETNFRDEDLLDIVAEFKRHNYATNLVYLTLKNIKESVSRVNQRVENGGHYVDHKNIEQNYDLGLQYLERFADRFDNLEIIDTSGNDFQLRSVLSIQQQQLVYLSDELPAGVEDTIKRIASRYNSKGLGDDEERDRPRGPRR